MNRGLVQIRTLHAGHLSKRRQEGRTRGLRMNGAAPCSALANLLRRQEKSTSSPVHAFPSQPPTFSKTYLRQIYAAPIPTPGKAEDAFLCSCPRTRGKVRKGVPLAGS